MRPEVLWSAEVRLEVRRAEFRGCCLGASKEEPTRLSGPTIARMARFLRHSARDQERVVSLALAAESQAIGIK